MDYDVFLCHNSKDKKAVKKIGLRLRQAGFKPWLAESELQPGQHWQNRLEEQIATIRTAAIFVGPEGIGPWQDQEVTAFLREMIKRKCPVIPVMLPGCPAEPKLPIFLEGLTWVDFRQNEPDPFAGLIWGINSSGPIVTPESMNVGPNALPGPSDAKSSSMGAAQQTSRRQKLVVFAKRSLAPIVLSLLVGGAVFACYEFIRIPELKKRFEEDRREVPRSASPACVSIRRKAVVVFVDGYGKFADYKATHEAAGISTSSFLKDQASAVLGQSIEAHDEVIHQSGKIEVDEILGHKPDLIVLHRSTFSGVAPEVERDRFEQLLSKLRSTTARILVFSREDDTDGEYASKLDEKLNLPVPLFAYQFRMGHPWDDPTTLLYFLHYIDTLAEKADLYTCTSQ
jgi:hypothetical protein